MLEQRLRGRKTNAPKAKPGIPRRTADGPVPLSFAQQRLWLLDQIEPGLTAYNLPLAIRIRGSLDVEALERAVAEVVRRHDALRTTFTTEGNQPAQVVAPPQEVTLPTLDLAGLSSAERTRTAQELASTFARSPFDLRQGPLWRTLLMRLGEKEHLFLLTMHHIITDAWSLGVFARELSVFYAASTGHAAETLPPLPVQYADVAAWEREHLPRVMGEQLAYWKRHLADVPALDLPTDRPRPAVQTYQGGKGSLKLPRSLAEAVGKLSRREEATSFMTLLTAFQVLLHRLSGQDDFAVGVPIAGRGRREMEGLIGFFVSTLALRADLSGAPSFREALQRTRHTALEAYGRQDVPFEKIVEEVQPERDLSRPPVFQVMFNHLREVDETRVVPRLAGLQAERVPRPDPESKFDLTLYAIEEEDGIHLDVVYSTDLFEPERMEELLRQYHRLLEQIVENPETPINQISLVTEVARAVLPDSTQALAAQWYGSVAERVTQQAERCPEQVAVADAQVRWSYAELEARSNRLAHHLVEQGIGSGDMVAVYAHRSAALVEAVLGMHKAGAAFLLLDPAYPAARLIDHLRQAKPSGWLHLEQASDPPGVLASFVQEQCRVKLSLPADGVLAGYPTHPPDVRIEPDSVAYVSFTSGSTGRPKGIVATHRPLGHFLDWHTDTFGLGPADRFSMLSGLAHDPLLRDLFAPLWAGATLCIPDPETIETPGRLAKWMRDEAITATHLTPAMSQLLTATGPSPGSSAPLSALRYAFFGGDVLTQTDVERLRQRAPRVQCVNFYGATETPQGVGCYVVPETADQASESEARSRHAALPLGRGIEGVQLLVVNAAGEQAGIGEVGEIQVRTPYLAQGYLNDPERTRARFLSDGDAATDVRRYRTGDRGRYLPDGTVVFAGRADQQVKIRGYRIEPGEIEAILNRHPDVAACAVQAWGETSDRRQLAAYVVGVGGEVRAEVLRAYLNERLPAYMVPALFMPIAALPRTPNGKLDRAALPPPTPRRTSGEKRPPQTPEEAHLTEICREVLEADSLGVEENLFEVGLNSLLVVQVSLKAQAAGLDIEPRQFFEHQTVAALAASARRVAAKQSGLGMGGDGAAALMTEGAEAAERASLVPIASEGAKPPLFSVGAFLFQKLAPYWTKERPLYGLLRQDLDLVDLYAFREIEALAADYIKAMRRQQPRGPYHLVGFCFGGLVAYEMAHQLRDAGEEIEQLLLIDTRSPLVWASGETAGFGRPERENRVDFHLRQLTEEGPSYLRTWVRERLAFEGRRWLQKRREWAGRAYRIAGREMPLHLHRDFTRRADSQAAKRYHAKTYAGDVTLMRGSETPYRRFKENGEPDPLGGWEGIVTGGLRLVEVPGHHGRIFEEPNVRTLARRIAACLEEPVGQLSESL